MFELHLKPDVVTMVGDVKLVYLVPVTEQYLVSNEVFVLRGFP